MAIQVKKAKRQKLKGKIALQGASGSGKTLGALLMAFGMVGDWEKVGIVDTEHERALIYADATKAGVHIGEFMHVNLEPPYNKARYMEAVQALYDAGCEVVIVDSLSHSWAGQGGMLDLHASLGGKFQDWAKVTPEQQELIDFLMFIDCHIIANMRTKQEYAMQQNGVGKTEVVKLGTKPIQRDDVEYEFMLVFHIDQNHNATATKDNTELFEGTVGYKIGIETGKVLADWLDKGIDVKAQQKERTNFLINEIQTMAGKSEELQTQLEASIKKMKKSSLEKVPLEYLERIYTWLQDETAKLAQVAAGEQAE